MTDLIARENDIVTCVAKNHPIFRVKRDIGRGERRLAADIEVLHPEMSQPVPGTQDARCMFCGSPYIGPGGRIHFEDGYH